MSYGLTDQEVIKYKELSALSSSKISREEVTEKATLEKKSEDKFLKDFLKYREEVRSELKNLPTINSKSIDNALKEGTPPQIVPSPSLQDIKDYCYEIERKKARLVPIHNDLCRIQSEYDSYIEEMEAFILAYAPLPAEWRAKGFVGTLCADEKLARARIKECVRSINAGMNMLKERYETLSRVVSIYQLELSINELPPSAQQAMQKEEKVEKVPSLKTEDFDSLFNNEEI